MIYKYALLFKISIIACLFIIATNTKVLAQPATITYPTSAQNITRAFGNSKLTVKIVFNGACTGATTVKIALPASVAYIVSSISKTGGTSALSIAESSITDLRNPVFSISGISASSDEITFQLSRKADCGTLTSAKDSVFVYTSGGCSNTSEIVGTKNTYNILAPSLSISPTTAITGAVLDTTANRTATITNGGNGVTDTVHFFIVYPNAGIVNTSGSNTITANTVSFNPYRTSGDSLFYKIYGSTIFSGDSIFSNGETINIVEPIKVAKCVASTYYGVAWGLNATQICNWFFASSNVIMATGTPNYTSMSASTVGYTNKCSAYDYDILLGNGGTGNPKAATMYDINVFQGQGGSTSLASYDTSLFSLTDVRIGTTLVAFTFSGGIMSIDLNNKLTSDPDGAGVGIEDIDGDGYYDDLAPGNYLKIRSTITYKCDRACGAINANNGVYATISYRTMCSSTFTTADRRGSSINYIYESYFTGAAYVPANIVGGTAFRFQAKAAYYSNSSVYTSSATRYCWKIILPTGFSVSGTGTPKYGTTAVSYTLSGDTIIYTSSSNNLDSFNIDLVYTCGTSGNKTISYTLEKISNLAAGCKCQGDFICASVNTLAFCPTTCTSGPTTFVPQVRRADSSLGWTDYTLATRVSASAISAYDLSKALYLDTINIIGSALQNDSSNNLHVELRLNKTTISPTGVDKLTPIKIEAAFYRADTFLSSCTLSTYSTSAATATVQSVDFNLTSCVTSIGGLLPDDSISVIASFVVSTNNNLPQSDFQSGGNWTFFNVNSAGSKISCNTTVPEMYLVGTSIVNGANAFLASGCASSTLGGGTNYIARRFNTSGELFKNEFRPVMYVDSIVATIPSGYNWNYTHFQPTAGPTYTSLSPSISGNRYSFTNPGTWQALGLTVSNAYGAYIPFNVSPNCSTQPTESINFKIYIRDFYYAYAGGATPSGLAYVLGGTSGQTRNISYLSSQKPNIELIDQTGIVQGVKNKLSWKIRMINSGLNTAPYTWLAIPVKSGITVTKITEIATGDTLIPLTYSAGYWYKASSSGITTGAYKDYKIDFTFNSCSLDSLKVIAGWNCSEYPSSPDAYACETDSVFLKVSSEPSQVQLNILRQPGGGSTVDLCTTDSLLLLVNSAQAANLMHPYVIIYPPLGFNVSSPIKVEYPYGSGDYQNATVSSIAGGGLKIDLDAHTTIDTNGILGTASSSASYSPLGGDRQAKIRLNYTTDCDLTSGYSFVFYAYGQMPCGIAALGNGVSASTSALDITGATTSGTAGAVINITAGSLSCGTATTINLTSVPTGMPTQAGDTMIYILPVGLGYAGSFVKGTNCDSCDIKVESGSAGSTVVKVKLKTGVAASSSLIYSFDVIPKGISCNDAIISGMYKRNISSLMCGSVFCSNSSVFIATFSSSAIPLLKPNIQLNKLSLLDTNVWITGTSTNKLQIKYTNTGSLAYTANTDSVELFCGTSSTPFAVLPLAKSVAIGGIDSDIHYVTVPSTACSAADLVAISAKVKIITSSGTEQCLCDSSVQILGLKPTVSSAISYCQGATAAPLVASGISLKWYTLAIGGIGSATAPTPSTAVAGNKSYYVSQTSSTGIEGPRAEIVVTTNRTPAPPAVETPVAYCLGASAVSLVASSLPGDTLLWYSSATGGTGTTYYPTPSTTTAGTFTYYVSAKTSFGCESPRDSIKAIINPTPKIPTFSSPVQYCLGDTAIALSVTPALGDTLYWYTTLAGAALASAPIPNTSVVGTTTYFLSVKSVNNCASLRDSLKVVVNPIPTPPIVSSPVWYCQGIKSVALTATAGATDTIYWHTSAIGGTGSKTAPIPSTATTGTTTYYVSRKNASNCESARDSIVVKVNPYPANPKVTSPVDLCQGAIATALSATITAGDTLIWHSSATGGTSTTTAPIPGTSTKGTTTYYVSVKTAFNCESSRDSIVVNINGTPGLPIISTPVSYCLGATASALSATSASADDTVLWYSAATGGTPSYTSPTPSTATIGTTKYFVSLKSKSNCEGKRDSITVVVNSIPAKPSISSPLVYCQGAAATALTATKAAADTLIWFTTLSGGTGTTTAPIPSTTTVGTTTYYVGVKNASNCESVRDSIKVIINSTPALPTVSSPITYCQGATASTLSATKAISSDTLLWYTTAMGGTGTTTAPTPITASAGTSTYFVSAKNANNCESARDSIKVIVNPTPDLPIVTSPVSLCKDAISAVLSASKSASDTLVWHTSATGGTGTTTAPTPSTATVGTSTYYVNTKNAYNCESARDSIKVIVNDLPTKPIVVSPITYCKGALSTSLTASKASTSDTLLWYTAATGGTSSTTAPTPSTATVGTTTYFVNTKNAPNCESDRDSIKVIVNDLPSKPTVSSPIAYCKGDTSVALTASKASTSDTLLWYTSAIGGTGSTTAPTPSTATSGTTTYFVSSKNTNNCESERDSIKVIINYLPTKPTVISPIAYCKGATTAALSASKAATDTLVWFTNPTGGIGSTTAPTPSTATVGTTTYYVGSKNANNCESERDSIKVIINELPTKPTVLSPIAYCKGAPSLALSASKASTSDTLFWYTSATGGTGSTSAPSPSTATVGTTTYFVNTKNANNCESVKDSIKVIVNDLPSKPTIVSPIAYCKGATASPLTASKAVSDTLVWFTTATGGTGSTAAPTPSTASVGTTTYFVNTKNAPNCESDRDSIKVIVNDLPSKPTVVSPIAYCKGATSVALTASRASTSDTLLWYTSAVGGSGSITAPTPSTSSSGTTTYFVNTKNANNCESARDSIQVIVNDLPTKPTVVSPIAYCSGATSVALTASKASTSDTLLWYTAAIGGTGSTTTPTPSTTSSGTTTYFVNTKNANNCESARDSIKVIVNDLPSKPTVVSPIAYCKAATATALTASKASTSDTLFWYTSAIGGTGSITVPTPSTASSGTTTYYVNTKNANNCESPRDSIKVIVHDLPTTATVVSPIAYCKGATSVVLSASKASTSDTLLWYTAATGGTGSTTAPTPSTTSSGTTTYFVNTKNANNCESQRDSIKVIVNDLPTKPTVASPIAYCQGATASPLTASKSASDTLVWFTTATGGLGSTTAPTPSTATIGTTTYYVNTKNAPNCESERDSIVVNINPTPLSPTVASPIRYCQSEITSILTASATDTILWYTTATGGTGSKTAPTPSSAIPSTTTYYVSTKTALNCESARDSIVVNINPRPLSPTVTSPIYYCQGSTSSSLTAIKASTSDTLIWFTSATGGVGSTLAPTPSTSTTGTFTYYVGVKSAFNCQGPRDSIKVVINPTPPSPLVTSPLTYCQYASTAVLTASKSTTTGTLLWYTAASGGVGSTVAPTPSTSLAGTTTYYVSEKSNLNCEGLRNSINVIVNPTPIAPTVVSPISYCQGVSASKLTATKATSSDTLLWYTSASGGTGTTISPTPTTTIVGTNTFYVSSKTTLNCEGPRAAINVITNATPVAPIVVSPVSYCQYDTAISLSATKLFASDTLKWYNTSSGGTASLTTPIPNTSLAGTTNYYVSLSNLNACEGPRSLISVEVKPAPSKPLVSSPIAYCNNEIPDSLVAIGDLLKWYSDSTGGTSSSSAPTPSTSTVGSFVYYVSQTNIITACESKREKILVNINPLPLAPKVDSNINICKGSPSYTLSATGINLKWYKYPTGGSSSSVAPTHSTGSIGTTNYYVSQTSVLGCEGPRAKITLTVQPLPILTISSLSPSGFILCKGKSLTLKANALTAIKYQWSYEDSILIGANTDTLLVDTVGLYAVTVNDIYGCEAKDSVQIKLDTTKFPILSPVTVYKCEEATVLLTCHPGFVDFTFQLFQNGIAVLPATLKENIKTVSDSGTYFVVVTNYTGCKDTSNKSFVKHYPKPSKPSITLTGTLLETFGAYRHYQWYKNDKKVIGANGTKQNSTGPGYYFLEITDENGCLNQSDTIYIGNTTNINNTALLQLLKIYPNPTRGKVIIDAPIPVNVVVMDIVGKVIFKGDDVKLVDMSEFADGTYIFKLSDSDNKNIVNERIHKISTN